MTLSLIKVALVMYLMPESNGRKKLFLRLPPMNY